MEVRQAAFRCDDPTHFACSTFVGIGVLLALMPIPERLNKRMKRHNGQKAAEVTRSYLMSTEGHNADRSSIRFPERQTHQASHTEYAYEFP